MKFLQLTACVDDMTGTSSELTRVVDILRYVVVLIAIAGFAIALFG